MHFGAGRLGFGLVLPALENAESPYVIINRPSAVWQPVIDREKETQQHVGVKVRARSISSRFLDRRWLFKRGPRLDAARRRRDPGAVRPETARTRARSRRSRAARVGGRLPARAIEDAGGALQPSIAIVTFLGTSTLEATHGWFLAKISAESAVSLLRKCQPARAAGTFFSVLFHLRDATATERHRANRL